MKTKFFAVLLSTLCITTLQAYDQAYQSQDCNTCCEQNCDPCCNSIASSLVYSNAHIGYSTGDFIGIDEDYTEAGIFAPLYLDGNTSFFVDATGYRFNNSRWASSLGVGLRKRLCGCDGVAGVNVYWDTLQAECHKTFNRVGAGIEYLGRCWDFRANGYFATGDNTKKCHLVVFDDYIGDFYATCRSKQSAIMTGFDAEIGVPLYNHCFFDVYAAAGPYYYSGKDTNHFWGGYARLELDWHSIITLRVRTSYDDVYKSRTQGQIELSLPFEVFCGKFDCLCNDDLLRPVYRQGLIFTRECCDYTWNW